MPLKFKTFARTNKPAKKSSKPKKVSMSLMKRVAESLKAKGSLSVDANGSKKTEAPTDKSTARQVLTVDQTKETLIVPDTNYFAFVFPELGMPELGSSEGPRK